MRQSTAAFSSSLSAEEPGSPTANSKKKQKAFILDVQKAHIDKVRERLGRGLDPNFWSENEETPLSIAVLNNDKDMLLLLIEFGAFLDYRVGPKESWKTPLHLAAQHNKPLALQKLLSLGAWVNAVDILGLPALAYAVQNDNPECVHRLLLARADTNIELENGKTMLHQSCFNNNEFTCALLADFGANLNAQNVSGNTPLHIAATRNAKGCIKWLLSRGAAQDIVNKTGQVASALAAAPDVKEYMDSFTPDDLEPFPPKFKYTDNAECPFTFSTLYAPRVGGINTSSSHTAQAATHLQSISNSESIRGNLHALATSTAPVESPSGRRSVNVGARPRGASDAPDPAHPGSSASGRMKKSSVPPPPSTPPPLPPTPEFVKQTAKPAETPMPNFVDLGARIKQIIARGGGAADDAEVESLLESVVGAEEYLKKSRDRASRAELEVKTLREMVQKGAGKRRSFLS
ncbi:MAG: hypothetical protein SGCHY_003287 [Lobulomycetales sp.]